MESPKQKTFLQEALSPQKLLEELVYGSIAGAGMCLVGHPFDTLKTRMQADRLSLSKAYRQIAHKEGLKAFYKGMSTPFGTIPIINSIIFTTYEISKEYFENEGKTGLEYVALSGAIAGLANSYIIGPVELIKIKMQMQKSSQNTLSPMSCFWSIIQRNGVKGLFQGSVATLLAEAPAYMAQFLIYEFVKRRFLSPGTFFGKEPTTHDSHLNGDQKAAQHITGWRVMVAGGLSGYFCWFTCLPADVIKTKIQFREAGFYPSRFGDGGILHVSKRIWATDGIKGFYRGFSAISGRAVLSNAIGFWLWEMSRSLIQF